MIPELVNINTFFMLGLTVVVAGFMLHASYSLINLIRLRGVRMNWGDGRFGGFSSGFWGFTALFFAGVGFALLPEVGWLPESGFQALVGGVMGWVGFHGALASCVTRRVYVTDNGLVKSLNNPDGAIAWYQVTDYVVRERNGSIEYLIIFQEFNFRRDGVQPCSRLLLTVPESKRREFEKIVSYKLGRSIERTTLPALDLRMVK